jgi:hypothetical protein
VITLIASNQCDQDTTYQTIYITEVGLDEWALTNSVRLFPNPSHGKIFIENDLLYPIVVNIYNAEGKMVEAQKELEPNQQSDFIILAKGLYLVHIRSGKIAIVKKHVVE